MSVHVINEAKRCLNCKKPGCIEGCPIKTPIPVMIQGLLTASINEAGRKLFDNNPLSIICSLVCDHEKQCEGHCVLQKKGSPVHISSIENYISDTYFDKSTIQCKPKNGKKVAVIGSGPAGITISILLSQKGYEVTVFEARDRIGGVLQYGIPDFRLPKTILDRYKEKLISIGVKIRPNTTIGGALTIDHLFRDGYCSIFIGTGVWRPRTLGIKGESLGNVHFAIDYLANPSVYNLGDTVAVIGAGNAAMDVARTALRKGVKKITFYEYHRTAAASTKELEYAMLDGAEIRYCKDTMEIREEGPVFRTVRYDEEDRVVGYSDEMEYVEADSTIIAVSQCPKTKLVDTTKGLHSSRNGLLIVDENGATTQKGVFASGDVVNGARTVVEAVEFSKRVAEAMDSYMRDA